MPPPQEALLDIQSRGIIPARGLPRTPLWNLSIPLVPNTFYLLCIRYLCIYANPFSLEHTPTFFKKILFLFREGKGGTKKGREI